ncbi:Flp pilus assembly protein CpaB [Cupriavidus basilensis]
MKNTRAILMLLIALLAGVAAVVSASRWLMEQSSSSVKQVVVAANDLNLGQPLNGSQLRLVNWPAASVPPGAFEDLKLLEGRVVRTSLQRGEPILDAKLAPVGTKADRPLSSTTASGPSRARQRRGGRGRLRAAGQLRRRDRVNTNEEAKTTQNGSISKIVLEKILVLAVAQQVSRDDTRPKVVNAVTLEVTPDQAEKLDVARSVGILSLVLRNQMDVADINTGGRPRARCWARCRKRRRSKWSRRRKRAPWSRPARSRHSRTRATASACWQASRAALECF